MSAEPGEGDGNEDPVHRWLEWNCLGRARARFTAVAAVVAAMTARAPAAFAGPAAPPNGSSAAYGCAGAQGPASSSTVIVSAVRGHRGADLPAAVDCVAGRVDRSFSSFGGVLATVPTGRLGQLRSDPNLVVTPDVPVSVQSTVESTGPHTPSAAFLQETGATTLAAAGDTGAGTNVAVLDTGIGSRPAFGNRLLTA